MLVVRQPLGCRERPPHPNDGASLCSASQGCRAHLIRAERKGVATASLCVVQQTPWVWAGVRPGGKRAQAFDS